MKDGWWDTKRFLRIFSVCGCRCFYLTWLLPDVVHCQWAGVGDRWMVTGDLFFFGCALPVSWWMVSCDRWLVSGDLFLQNWRTVSVSESDWYMVVVRFDPFLVGIRGSDKRWCKKREIVQILLNIRIETSGSDTTFCTHQCILCFQFSWVFCWFHQSIVPIKVTWKAAK